MSLTRADTALGTATDALWLSVAELAVTVHEDRPAASDLAMVDDLAERVSELQGRVHALRLLCGGGSEVGLPARLDDVAALVDDVRSYYWRELRTYERVARLRAAARRRDDEWRAWSRSVEDAVERCEPPLDRVSEALRTAWHEVAALVSLGVTGAHPDSLSEPTHTLRRPS